MKKEKIKELLLYKKKTVLTLKQLHDYFDLLDKPKQKQNKKNYKLY